MVLSFASPSRKRSIAAEGLAPSRPAYGSINLFCFEGGRISSRSTGTPRLTRKSRLIRERVQFGGCIGGGETSCCQRERERSERKGVVVVDEVSLEGGVVDTGSEFGRMALM